MSWRYSANKVVGNTWMVKRFHMATSTDDESNYDEAEIEVATNDPDVAIAAAIARDSWG